MADVGKRKAPPECLAGPELGRRCRRPPG